MSEPKKPKIVKDYQEDDDDRQGGRTGDIAFHYVDPLSGAGDPELPPNWEHTHKSIHKGHVEDQARTLAERKNMKDGKYTAGSENRTGMGSGPGGSSKFPPHPLLNGAQWAGVDKQASPKPDTMDTKNNPEMQNKLELTHTPEKKLRMSHSNTPTFKP